MTTKTPEALELAARFERHARYHGQDEQAATLLRSQHQRIEALEKALRAADLWTDEEHDVADWRTAARALLSTTQQGN